ncbi:MAG: VOC family protein [Nitrospira sp.]|nr:VOC family protein [Candidatus Manganitrophaceae bacterium]HIL34161.1 VOC family protein [Candidatus Manganitrophaceae bacterium]
MSIQLNHTIVPSHDRDKSAAFFSRILGLKNEGAGDHFVSVRVNDTLTFLFDQEEEFDSHHYAFKVSEKEFDEIFGRIQNEKILYGSRPSQREDMNIYEHDGGRGLYFCDVNGHVLEVLTVE